MEAPIIGKCETMCPLDEIEMRTRERLLHFYERWHPTNPREHIADESKVVKEFARSAAGMKTPKPHNLRTKQCLKRTVNYLLREIVTDERKPFHYAYDFIFDRLRAVRQEIVIQDFDEITSIELIEPIVMFLAYSLYRLAEEPIDRFDPKICRQHLQECLKKVLRCYDSLDESPGLNQDVLKATKHRELIESLYLLFNLGSGEVLARAIKIPTFYRNSMFKRALKISLCFWTRNLYKCLKQITQLPYILSAVASLHVQSIRRTLIENFSAAYHSKVLTVPLDWLKDILFYSSIDQLANDLKYYGLTVDTQLKSTRFQQESFQASKPLVKTRREHFADEKLKSPIENILLFND